MNSKTLSLLLLLVKTIKIILYIMQITSYRVMECTESLFTQIYRNSENGMGKLLTLTLSANGI